MKSGNSQQQQRHFNPRVNYNHVNQSPVVVPPIQQPQPPPPQQQPHLYSRNQAYLNHPVDMPPVETVVARLETACRLLHGIGNNNTKVAEISSEIQILSDDLRRVGPHLELAYPDVLDRVMSSMRDASAQPCLPPHLRLAIFELVELRASKWLLPSDSSNYYRQRRSGHEDVESVELASSHAKPGSQGAASQEKSDGKTYREEILIKNSDSGKVMGVRGRRVHIIEALSDTIISFEKVNASAKERVLSINGYSQQSINMAKSLIHETINRNSSPVFDSSAAAVIDKKIAGHSSTVASSEGEAETNSVGSAGGGDVTSTGQFTYTVAINDEVIKVSGNNFTLVQEAKLALDDYFSSKYNLYPEIDLEEMEASVANGLKSERNSDETKDIQKYSREDLLTIEANLMWIKPNFAHLDQTIQDAIVLKSPKRINQSKAKVPTSTSTATTA